MPDGRRIDLSLPLFAFRATHAAAKRSLRVPVGMRRPAVARQALGSVHWRRQAGQTPPVSKVFHRCPQEQAQKSPFRGDQPHSGHRMRGPDGLRLSSCPSSVSRTVVDLAEVDKRAGMVPVLCLGLVSSCLTYLLGCSTPIATRPMSIVFSRTARGIALKALA
jgi:hypothetical protein